MLHHRQPQRERPDSLYIAAGFTALGIPIISGTDRPRTEQVNIGWLLQDVETATGDGGLMLVPGSHKARLPLPRPKQTSCDLPQVKHMQGVAGTVIMYAGTTTHGVRSWRNPHRERRFVNTKAGPNIRRPAPDPV